MEHRHGYTAQLARLERSESPEEVFDVLKELEQHLPEGSPLKESFSAWADILVRLMDSSLSPDVIGKNLSMMQVNNMYTDYTEILGAPCKIGAVKFNNFYGITVKQFILCLIID